MSTTVVGIFNSFEQAQQAARELETLGVSRENVAIARGHEGTDYAVYGGQDAQDYSEPKHVKGGISGFFENLFGSDVDERDRGLYSEAARRGRTVVTVTVGDDQAERVADIMDRYDAVDVDRLEAQYGATGYTAYDPSAPVYTPEQTRVDFDQSSRTETDQFGRDSEVALPVIEEELKVGKRAVRRGGVRVYSRVTERPVEEQVHLREEHVTVDRRPVNRAVTDADTSALRDSEIVLTETAEEAVTSKEARVIEEVVVGKTTTERTETVRDTVRRTDVDVEQIDADVTTRSSGGTTKR
jgi:uncharacterized protein (TIGR02271 family)